MIIQLCICDQCQHAWMGKELPERCPRCHRRSWNGKGITTEEVPTARPITRQTPTAGSDMTASGEKQAETSDAVSLVKSLCRHGVYKALCQRCKAA